MIYTKKIKLVNNTLKVMCASLVLSMLITNNLVTANTFEKNAISSEACFKNIKLEANFTAFTTTKNSRLADWYQEVFALSTVKEFSFPDGKTTGILMHKDDFIIEVFFKEDILRSKNQVPQSTSEQWQGVNKVGIFTNADLPTLKQCLIKVGVNASRIWHDKNLPINLLQVEDPDGNVLEIISRRSNSTNVN